MILDWNDLRFLLAAHQKGSLAAAAKSLKVTKATVSRRLAALEEALGMRVVERSPSGLTLTPAGREVLAAAEGVASTLGSLEQRLAEATDAHPRGTVRLTGSAVAGSAPAHPRVAPAREAIPSS